MGVSAAGVNLTSGNIGLKLAPRGQAASYLAARGIIIAIAGAIAPLVGGLLADFFTGRHLFLTFNWEAPEGTIVFNTVDFSGLDFVFLISVVIGVYSLHRLALVKEVGEVKEKDVIDAILSETRRNVRTLSTIDGLRQTFQAPLTTVRKALQKKKEPQRTTFE
jgi:MFS family permease